MGRLIYVREVRREPPKSNTEADVTSQDRETEPRFQTGAPRGGYDGGSFGGRGGYGGGGYGGQMGAGMGGGGRQIFVSNVCVRFLLIDKTH